MVIIDDDNGDDDEDDADDDDDEMMMMMNWHDNHHDASSASPAVIVIMRFDWHASIEPTPILERSFSFLGLVHFCKNLERNCAAVSAYNSAAAGSMCRDVAFAVEAHRRSPRKPTSFLAASRGRNGSHIVAKAVHFWFAFA